MHSPFSCRWLEPFWELILPERCRICNISLPRYSPKGICRGCLSRIEYMGAVICRRCGTLMPSNEAAGSLCGGCIRKPPFWDTARSVVRYGPEVRHLLSRLKYQTDTTVLPALSTIVQPVLATFEYQWEHILPVPLYRARLQQRGMNQAMLLAAMLFPGEGKRINPHLLQRNRATASQTGLDGAERRRNLRGAFGLTDPGLIVGRRVMIVDDVFTTGSTVMECAKVVRRAGAAEIGILTFARVVMGV